MNDIEQFYFKRMIKRYKTLIRIYKTGIVVFSILSLIHMYIGVFSQPMFLLTGAVLTVPIVIWSYFKLRQTKLIIKKCYKDMGYTK